MQVHEVMTREVEFVHPDSTLQEAASKMKARDIGPLPVCDKGWVVGMLTDRDITVRATAQGKDPKAICVRDVMTPEVIACSEDQPLAEAARLMAERQVRRLLVLNRDKQLVGVVSLGDLAIQTGHQQLAGEILDQVSEPAPPAIGVGTN
jgi:CBS domain-containing protein